MPNIRPSSELRNNYQEMSKICKETKAPIYLTVNGKGDTALIDIEVLDGLYSRLDLFTKISEGLKNIDEGKFKTQEEVFSKVAK